MNYQGVLLESKKTGEKYICGPINIQDEIEFWVVYAEVSEQYRYWSMWSTREIDKKLIKDQLKITGRYPIF